MKRKRILSALMMTCVLLAGCGRQTQQERFEAIRRPIADAQQVTLSAEVRASFPERVEEFSLDCEKTGDAWTVTVTAPERIAGVTAHMDGGTSDIRYDGVILSTGDLTSCGVAPVNAVPIGIESLSDGYLDSSWTESGGLAVKVIRDDHVSVTVWFDETDVPRAMELAEDGEVKVSCTIENFMTEGTKDNGNTEETDLGGNSPGESGA